MADRRTWVSGLLALAGTVTFWAAMGMPAIAYTELRAGRHPIDMGLLNTWTLPFTSPELAPVFVACALAPFGWMAAAWGRSPWARNVSAMIVGTAALMVFGLGAMPGAALEFAKPFTMWRPNSAPYLDGGWWSLGAAAATLAASFVVLRAPERPEAGEDLAPEVVRTARTRAAVVTAIAAGVGVAALTGWLPAQIPPRYHYYRRGLIDLRAVKTDVLPLFTAMFGDAPLVGALYVLTPLLLVAAWRWRSLRLPAAAAAAATICAMMITKADGYWTSSPQNPAPLALGVWYLVPGALLVAALLLPPAAAGEASRCPAPAPAA